MVTFCLVLLLTFQPAGAELVTLARGATSEVEEQKLLVVRSPADLSALWKTLGGEAAAPPRVNFSAEMVVGVFLGTRPTAGFGVEILGVRRESGVLVVEYAERPPAPDAIVAQVLTSPFHIVKLSRHAGTVRFELRTSRAGAALSVPRGMS